MVQRELKTVLTAISSGSSHDIIKNTLLGLEAAIGSDYLFVAKIDELSETASSEVVIKSQQLIDNFSYHLKGTPCELVAGGRVCIYTGNVQPLFPQDTLLQDMQIESYAGIPLEPDRAQSRYILVAMFHHGISDQKRVTEVFSLFAGLILKELERRFLLKDLMLKERIMNETHDAVMVANHAKEIIYVNEAFTSVTGYQLSDICGKNPRVLKSSLHDNQFYQKLWSDLIVDGYWQGDIVNRKKNGDLFTSSQTISVISADSDNEFCYVSIFTDVTERKRKEKEQEYADSHDLVTDCLNRKEFERRVKTFHESDRGVEQNTFLMLMGIDHFREINTTYGYDIGNTLLKKVANRIQQTFYESVVLARVSGDVFALFGVNATARLGSEICARRIVHSFQEPFPIMDSLVRATLSLGIYEIQDASVNAEECMKMAEIAMYTSKASGRNTWSYYSAESHNRSIAQAKWRKALSEAIKRNALQVHYQPIVDVRTRQVQKFEALVRWNHEGQWVSPEDFIPLAEESGSIYELGLQVLELSCRFLKMLESVYHRGFMVNVNRSIVEFNTSDCAHAWIDIIRRHGLKYSSINFELTESVLANANQGYIESLSLLQEFGCKISLDDFGTGYSSLSYLRRFPVDELKIDRSFISDLNFNHEDQILVKTILAMAQALKTDVVAEGVETEDQLALLQSYQCHLAQGYYISKPLSEADVIPFLNKSLQSVSPIALKGEG